MQVSLQRITKEPGRNEREDDESAVWDTVGATTSRREIGKITRAEIERKIIKLERNSREWRGRK